MRRWISFITALLLIAPPLVAASSSLRGVVTDIDQQPLAKARLELWPLSSEHARSPRLSVGHPEAAPVATASTNDAGLFVIEVPTVGVWRVVAEAPGYLAMSLEPLAVVGPRVLPPVALPPEVATAGDEQDTNRDGWRVESRADRHDPGDIAGPSRAARSVPRPPAVVGRVLDAVSRQPVTGALIWSGSDPGAFVFTDGQGRFELAIAGGRRPWIQADVAGYLPQARWLDPPSDSTVSSLTLALEPAVEIDGSVTDREGRPVEGAVIEAASLTPVGRTRAFHRDRAVSRGLSDAAGRFTLHRLHPDGSFELAAEKRGFGPARVTVSGLRDRQPRPGVRIVLPSARRAYGRVVDAEQQPLAGVEVSLRPAGSKPSTDDQPSVRTDAGGRFEAPALPATRLDIAARKSGFAPATVRGIEAPPGDGPVDLGTMILVAGATVAGKVIDTAGEPVAAASVWITEDLGRSSRSSVARLRTRPADSTTGSRGRFQLEDLEHGRRWRLLIDGDGFLPAWVMGVEGPAAEPLSVTLLPASRIRGEVVDEQGVPVARATVSLRSPDPPLGTVGVVLPREENRRSATTGGDGSFEVEKVAPGKRLVTVTAEGFQSSEPMSLEVPRAEGLEGLRITLERGAMLEGSVIDGRGAPVAGARLRATGTSTTSDGEGVFRLTGLALGKQLLMIDHPRHNRRQQKVELKPGFNTAEVVLRGGWPVAGWAVDEAGKALPGVHVELRLQGRASREYQAMTGDDGHFRFPAVAEGVYGLVATKERLAPLVQENALRVSEEPIDDLEIELRRGGAITGRLLGLEPDELATARIEAERDGQPARRGQIDYQGHYEIPDLEPGDWQLRASARGGTRQADAWVVLEPGTARLVRDLELGGGSTLAGRVTYGDRPLAETIVSVTGYERGVSRRVTSDHSGIYRFEDLPPSRYRVAVTNPRELLLHNEDIELTGDRELDIEIATGRISGFVISADDAEPLPDVQLVFEQLLSFEGTQPGSIISLTTDSEGLFSAARLPAGQHRLTARKSGYVPLERALEVSPGEALDHLELTLSPTRGLSLYLHTTSGRVPRTAKIHVFDASGRQVLSEVRRATARGYLPFATVPPGTWTVLVSSPGAVSRQVVATVPGEPLRLVLEDAARVTVRVPPLMESNHVATLSLSSPDGSLFRGVDPGGVLRQEWPLIGGRTTLDGVPAGQWIAQVVAVDGRSWAGPMSTGSGTSVEVTLE